MLNTMTMAVLERTQEISLLRAVGWQRWRICAADRVRIRLLSVVGAVLRNLCRYRLDSGGAAPAVAGSD